MARLKLWNWHKNTHNREVGQNTLNSGQPHTAALYVEEMESTVYLFPPPTFHPAQGTEPATLRSKLASVTFRPWLPMIISLIWPMLKYIIYLILKHFANNNNSLIIKECHVILLYPYFYSSGTSGKQVSTRFPSYQLQIVVSSPAIHYVF